MWQHSEAQVHIFSTQRYARCKTTTLRKLYSHFRFAQSIWLSRFAGLVVSVGDNRKQFKESLISHVIYLAFSNFWLFVHFLWVWLFVNFTETIFKLMPYFLWNANLFAIVGGMILNKHWTRKTFADWNWVDFYFVLFSKIETLPANPFRFCNSGKWKFTLQHHI